MIQTRSTSKLFGKHEQMVGADEMRDTYVGLETDSSSLDYRFDGDTSDDKSRC